MNYHERGQKLLNRVTSSTAGTGVSVTYTRGTTTAAIVATPLAEPVDATNLPGPTGRSVIRERTYFIVYADLVAAGFDLPQNGDRIVETLNGESATYEVTPERTTPAYRWADAQQTRVRVRTIPKKVS